MDDGRRAHPNRVTSGRNPLATIEAVTAPSIRDRVESHLGSDDVAHVLYGATVALALIIAVQDHPPHPGSMVAYLLGTGITIGLAELYADAVSTEARTRSRVTRHDLRHMAREASATAFGTGFPAVFFALVAAGVMHMDTAFTVSKWSGLGLICGYGYLADRLAGSRHVRAASHAFVIGVVGVTVILLKSLVH